MSTHQKALVLPIKQGTFELHSVPIPTPGPGQLLVRMHAVALNPVDWKVQARGILVEDYPFILGTDNAGTVEVIGEEVYGFKRVIGSSHKARLRALMADSNSTRSSMLALLRRYQKI